MKIRIALILFFATIISITTASAQLTSGNQHFAQDQLQLNVGIGLLPTYYGTASATLPPVSVSGEYGITDKIGVGGFIGYSTGNEEWFGGKINYSFLIIGARGSYHFGLFDKMDTYGGLMLGYNVVSATYDDNFNDGWLDGYGAAASGMTLSAYVGARYPFNEKFSVYGELGYGIAVLNIGASFTLK